MQFPVPRPIFSFGFEELVNVLLAIPRTVPTTPAEPTRPNFADFSSCTNILKPPGAMVKQEETNILKPQLFNKATKSILSVGKQFYVFSQREVKNIKKEPPAPTCRLW